MQTYRISLTGNGPVYTVQHDGSCDGFSVTLDGQHTAMEASSLSMLFNAAEHMRIIQKARVLDISASATEAVEVTDGFQERIGYSVILEGATIVLGGWAAATIAMVTTPTRPLMAMVVNGTWFATQSLS